MADGEWLTPVVDVRELSQDEREEYFIHEMQNYMAHNSEDEEETPLFCEPEAGVDANVNGDDSDAEQIQVPEYTPEVFSSDDEYETPAAAVETATNYTARDGTIWSTAPPRRRRTLSHNMLRGPDPGPTERTKNLSIMHTFKKFMDTEMCDIIIRETNRKAKACYNRANENRPNSPVQWKDITESEFDAYLNTNHGWCFTFKLYALNRHVENRLSSTVQRCNGSKQYAKNVTNRSYK